MPTQTCCLAHISTQLAALERRRAGGFAVPVRCGHGSGEQKFRHHARECCAKGASSVLEHHRAARRVAWAGDNVMYFETGQGSALSAEAHRGVDQLTLEARAYGVARAFDPFLVNSVVGFIGPGISGDERQIIRAGLEDHFMGKLLGLPMGCDVCYTNHAEADQNSADNLSSAAGGGGMQLFYGRPLLGRRDAELSVHELSRRAWRRAAGCSIFGPRRNFWRGWRRQGIYRNGEPEPA